MFSTHLLLVSLALASITTIQPDIHNNVDLPRHPSISPDGTTVIFSWRGDLWMVPTEGGSARRMTTHSASEGRSRWLPDGSGIVFESDRDGFQNVHMMQIDGTNLRQLTDVDRSLFLSDASTGPDGSPVVLMAGYLEGDFYRAPRPYMMSTEDGLPRRTHGAFGRSPSLEPGGDRILFTRGGSSWNRRHYRGPDDRDVWLYDPADDSFTQLTTWEGNDGMARWIGPGEIVYLSDRELDTVNLYRMRVGEPESRARRLTGFKEDDVQDFDVSEDGSTIVMSHWDDLYTLDLDDRDAQPRRLTILASEDEADRTRLQSIGRSVDEIALSPDGKVMAYVDYGEIFVRNVESGHPTRRVTDSHAREGDIAWSPDGATLYFTSDRDGTDSIYAASVTRTRGEILADHEESSTPVQVEEPSVEQSQETTDEEDEDSSDTDPEATDPADADEDSKDQKEEADEDNPADRWHDAIRFEITPVIVGTTNDREAAPSPDGRSIAFRRGLGDLAVLDLETDEVRIVHPGWDSWLDFRWSPDGRMIAFAQSDRNFNRDIWIMPADGSAEPVNITRHPANDRMPRWSADGRILAFLSSRKDDQQDIWMVYLDRDIQDMTDLEIKEYYKDAVAAAKKRKPLKPGQEELDMDNPGFEELDLDDAWLRLRRVVETSGSDFGSQTDLAITPGGDRYIFNGRIGGSSSKLRSIKWDGSDAKELGSTASLFGTSLDGSKVVRISSGQGGTVSPTGTGAKTHAIKDTLRIDLQEQNSQKFTEAARTVGEYFYHPTMKGLDWDRLTDRYHQLARQARTTDEFNHVAARFLGELNGSHLGITATSPSSPIRESHGYLGIEVRPGTGGIGYEVVQIIPESPAANSSTPLKVGDVITSIDFMELVPGDSVESRLAGRISEETVIGIVRQDDATGPVQLDLLIEPISWNALRELRYKAMQAGNRKLVDELSDGRIGYIHIKSMGQASLDEYERDLYAAADGRDGLIVDVRNNGGGWTADRLLASLMVRPHAYTVPRGADPGMTSGYPQDRLFIQRYILPVNMLCNEKSFSNAEIISHAFKSLDRGTLVGQQTYGGVISTGGTTLIDGTRVRLPFRGWFLLDGTDMENNGAIPDLVVIQTPESEATEQDLQLDAAVMDLLDRMQE